MEYLCSEGEWLWFMLFLVFLCGMSLLMERIAENIRRKVKRCTRTFRRTVPARQFYGAQLRRLRAEHHKVVRRVLRTLFDILLA